MKPLDLSRTPSTKELMAAGQLGGQLYPTSDIEIEDNTAKQGANGIKAAPADAVKLKHNRDINHSFGNAINEWNRHNYKQAVKMFKKHAQDYPDSPWVDESLLHVGCDARYNGRYTEAEEMFTTIIERNRSRDHHGATVLLNKARSRMAILKLLQSNFDESTRLFSEVKKESPEWRHRTYASHWIQRLSRYKGNELALLTCGTEALAHVLKKDGRTDESIAVADLKPGNLSGHSIQDLKTIATQYGYDVQGLKLAVEDLQSIPLPAIVQVNGKHAGDRGHYWVLEKIENSELKLFDSQSGRRFHQSPDEFAREWDGNAIVFSGRQDLPGVRLAQKEMEQIYGACCGAQRGEDNLGCTDRNAGESADAQSCCAGDSEGQSQGEPVSIQASAGGSQEPGSAFGSPKWFVNVINMNHYVTDIPLWYDPPIGRPVRIQLSYNSQSATAYNEPFGNKWQFNYGSYLVVDTGDNVTIFMPDGRRDIYTPDGEGGYTRPYRVYNDLTRISEHHYELAFPDGTVYVYNIPPGTGSLQSFLLEIRDAYGQKLTFTYNTDVELTTITDAVGRDTTLIYNGNGLVTQVDDPFGRSALFEYDGSNNLTKITDMGGYWSSFAYDTDVYMTKIENARGKWEFYTEPADGIVQNGDTYPPPGDVMYESYRITVTNPLGDKSEYMYYAGCAFGTCQGMTWYVNPEDYIPWESPSYNNFNGGPGEGGYGWRGYRGNAPMTVYFFTDVNGERAEIRRMEKPEGGKTCTIETCNIREYTYDLNGNRTSVKDSDGNTVTYTYNEKGRVTSITDAKDIVTNLIYDDNNHVDLKTIQNGLGTIELDYNSAHDVTSITDRLYNTTLFQYNSYGQLTQSTDPLSVVTAYTYDTDTKLLQQIAKSGSVVQSFTYDAVDRVDKATDATGVTLDYDYNDLNSITKITYPDAKFISYNYSPCCPRLLDSVTDRSGNTTTYTYDALTRLIKSTGPEGRMVRYGYDRNGNMVRFTDSNGNETTFEYDLDNRLVRRNYADGNFKTYSYFNIGLLKDATNARGITKSFTYDENYNLKTVSYSDATPGVTYTYDNYNRVTQREDGIGTPYVYGYDDNSRLTSIDGPWTNDTVTLQYNERGHVRSFTPQGGQSVTYFYDYDPEHPGDISLGRLKDIQVGTNTFTYDYTGVNPLVQKLTRPNGSYTDYLYSDPLKRLTELTNRTSADMIINKHVFTFNNLDLTGSETVTTGAAMTPPSAETKTYDYNNVNQLKNATNPSETFVYDNDGNMTQGYTPDGYVFTAAYDAENRITSLTYNDGSIDHETKYYYSGDSMLAKVEKYEDTIPVSDTHFVRVGFLPLQERDGTNAVTREYTWGLNMGGGIGGLLNLKQGGSDYSYLFDGKGNVMALIDSNQQSAVSYRYDAFGVLKSKTGTLDQPFQFSTKRYDELTGLSYYGYRFYNPAIGRWMTRDPLGESGGINLYGFVGNSVVNWVDPLGLYGTLSCSYYETRCSDTGSRYYCYFAKIACQYTIHIPFTNWDQCVRQCLQEYDFYDKTCSEDSNNYTYDDFKNSHVFCFSQCLKNSNIDPILPPITQ